MRVSLILLVVFLINTLCFTQSLDENNRKAQIQKLSTEVEYLFNSLNLPGLAVVVIKDGVIIHDQALGFANLATQERLTTDHYFWTASVTKVFTAATLLRFQAKHHLNLDDPIISFGADQFFLPARANKHITLRHLVTQTSEGNTPGEHFLYSFRYNWLVAPFNGWSDFEEALNTEIVDLKFNGLVAGYHRIKDSSLAIVMPHRFNSESGSYEESPDDRWEKVIPATNLLATPKGLARAGHALNDGIGLPENLSSLLNGSLEEDEIMDDTYGYGSFVTNLFNKRIIWQYGYGGAESSLLIRIPEDNLSISVLSNAADLSGVTRLGTGDLLKHPLADALFRHVILTHRKIQNSPSWDGPIEEIEKQFSNRKNDDLDVHAILTQALMQYRKPVPNKELSNELLALAAKLYPESLSKVSEPVLWLIVKHADKRYAKFVNEQLFSAFNENTLHPWFLGLAAGYNAAIDNQDLAIKYWSLNSNNFDFREHSQTSDACLSLALFYEESQPDKAVDLAWRALNLASWSFSWDRNQEARDLIKRVMK